jgi:hypothetical protein
MGVDGELYRGKYSRCLAQHMDHSISLVFHQRANILKSKETTVRTSTEVLLPPGTSKMGGYAGS